MARYLVIIPTYNERENIEPLLRRLFALNLPLDILFVDDNSPDGTAELISRQSSFGTDIHLVERTGKLGLASAYLRGMAWGLERDYEALIQMDADLSHQPEVLKQLLPAIEHHELVIGSRYVSRGAVENWSLIRRLISRGGSLYAKLVLQLPVNDLTGGFNLWHRRLLERMDLDSIKSNGYSFQIEMKHRAYERGATWLELPIVFAERRQGRSKLSKRIVLEAVWRVWLIALRSQRLNFYKKFIKFSLVGVTGLIIDIAIMMALVEIWYWSPLTASTASFVVAVINNFIWNKHWTYRDQSQKYFQQFLKFTTIALVGLVINFVMMSWLLSLGIYYVLCRLIAVSVIVLWNFFINSLWTFRKKDSDLSTES